MQSSGNSVIYGVAAGVCIGLALVIYCYCSQCLCFQSVGGDVVIVEEYGGRSSGADIDIVVIYLRLFKNGFLKFHSKIAQGS
jgi:hypothetical protein